MSMFVGEALAGDGDEIAHIDLLIGSKDGPVGTAFANALARQSEGHSNLLAVLAPNPSDARRNDKSQTICLTQQPNHTHLRGSAPGHTCQPSAPVQKALMRQ